MKEFRFRLSAFIVFALSFIYVGQSYAAICPNTTSTAYHLTSKLDKQNKANLAAMCDGTLDGSVTVTGNLTSQGNTSTALIEVLGVQAASIPDNAVGSSPATYNLIPNKSLITCDCLDADGCTVTVTAPEGGFTTGHDLTIIGVSVAACNFADTSGLTELAGAFAMGTYDSLHLVRITGRFVEVSRSNN